MTANPIDPGCTLAEMLAGTMPLTIAEKLRLIEQVADSVAAIHAAGQVHRAISILNVRVSCDHRCTLPGIELQVLLGGEGADNDLIPPDLRRSSLWHLPPDIESIGRLFREAGVAFEPRRIDLFQLGSLLCRVIANISVDDYLRSPRAKGQITLDLQRIIDAALGLDPSRRYVDASELARGVKLLATGADLGIPGGEPLAQDAHADSAVPARSAFLSETPVHDATSETAVPASGSGSETPLPFTRLGHYRIESRIGCGGMGDVYKGFDELLQRVVAIKVLPPELARNAELVKRFYAEASSIAKLVHNNITQIYFIGEDSGHHFFAMQYVDGESLGDLLERKHRLGIEETLAICEQCLAGLSLAHSRGLVHRDIKPGNILLDRQYRRALLADFGLAKALDAGSQMTATGVIMGTLDYISPEQGRGKPVDGRSDLYSFGVLMYQALSGKIPFEADTATAMLFKHAYDPPPPLCDIAPDIPPALAAIVERLLAKAPDDRYPSADALLNALQAFRTSQPAIPSSSTEHQPGGRRRRTVIFRAAEISEPPEVPAEFLKDEPRGWWSRLRRRSQSIFRRHAPEFLKKLQTTQQQIDGAIDQYERRVTLLEADIQQGESVLAELLEQAQSNEAAGIAAGRDSDSDAELRQRQLAADLRRNAEEQESQLGLMRLNVAQARARLLNLKGQRDLLNARLATAQVGTHRSRSTISRPGIPIWQWFVVVPLLGVICLAVGNIILKTRSPVPTQTVTRPGQAAGTPAPRQRPTLNPEYASLPGINELREVPTCLTIAPGLGPRRIAVGYDDGKVGIYDGTLDFRGQEPRKFIEPPPLEVSDSAINCLAISNNGQRLAVADQDGSVQVWDIRRRRVTRKLTGNDGPVYQLMFGPDDEQLFGATPSGILEWNITGGKLVSKTAPNMMRSFVRSFVFSRDGGEILVASGLGGAEGSVARWNALQKTEIEWFETAKEQAFNVAYLSSTGEVAGLATTRDAGNSNQCIQIWKPGTRSPVRKFGEKIRQVDFSADGRRAISMAYKEDTIIVWDVEQGRAVQTLTGHQGGVGAVSIAKSGNWGVSIGADQTLRVWELATPDDSKIIWDCLNDEIQSVAYARDGEVSYESAESDIAVVAFAPDSMHRLKAEGIRDSVDNEIKIYEFNNLERSLRGHQDRIASAVFSSDSRRVLSGSADGTVRLWDIQSEKELCKLSPGTAVNSVALDPQGRPRCVSGGNEDFARIWDLDQKTELRRLNGHLQVIRSVAYTPDGAQVITASADNTIKVWNAETGDELLTLTGHTGAVNAIAVSRDGSFVISGSDDATVRKWDLKSGQQLRVFHGHWRPVRCVAIAPDQLTVASGGADAMVRVWKLSKDVRSTSPTSSPVSPINLLEHIDLAQNSIKGVWKREGAALLTATSKDAVLKLFEAIPTEYQLKMVAERITGDGPFDLNLVNQGSAYRLNFDTRNGAMSTFEMMRDPPAGDHDLEWNGILLPAGRTHEIVVQARKQGISVGVDGRRIMQWSYPPQYLSKVPLAISLGGTTEAQFRISEMVLQPLQTPEDRRRSWDKEQTALVSAWDQIAAPHPAFAVDEAGVRLKRAGYRVPLVQTFQQPEQFEWQHVKLNTEGIWFGAIRFKSPLDVPADLHWTYAVADSSPEWQIIPAKGTMQAFDNFRVERSLELPNLVLPVGNRVILQSLPGGQIKPGEEYFIWFRFKEDKPVDLHCALQLVPTGNNPFNPTVQEIAQRLGLPQPFRYLSQSARELRREAGTHPYPDDFAVSPDRKWIAIASYQQPSRNGGKVIQATRLLDYQTGNQVHEFRGHQGRVYSILFTQDSRAVLIQDQTGECKLWDALTGQQQGALADLDDRYAFGIAPAGDLIAGIADTLNVWDLKTGKLQSQAKLAAPFRTFRTTFAKDPKEMMAADPQGVIHVFNIETGADLRQIPNSGGVRDMRASPDGRLLAIANDDDPVVKIWNIQSGTLSTEIKGHDSGVSDVDFSPDGTRLLTCGGSSYPTESMEHGVLKRETIHGPDHSIRLWDVVTGKELLRINDHPNSVLRIRFSASGEEAVSCGYDGTVRVWSLKLPPVSDKVATSPPVHTFEGHSQPVRSVAFSSDGQRALSGGGGEAAKNSIRVWDLAQKRELGQFQEHSGRISSISVGSDGKRVLSASADGQIRLWNIDTFQNIQAIENTPKRAAQIVRFSGNGKRYLAGGPALLELRGLEGDADTLSFDFSNGEFTDLDIDVDGQRVITSSQNESLVKVWDASTGRVTRVFSGHSAQVESISLADYGGQALSAGQDGTMRWWDINTGRQNQYFKGHTGAILCTAFSPDTRYALSGGQDGTVRLWDLHASTQLWQGEKHTGPVRSVAFSPDGSHALSGGEDHLVCLWRLPETVVVDAELNNDRKAAARILEKGGVVDVAVNELVYHFADQQVSLPRQQVQLLGIDFSKQTDFGDADLAMLEVLDHLKHLNLEKTKVTDAGMKHLQSMSVLESLNLAGTGVSGAGLKEITSLSHLRTLDLSGLKLDGSALKRLQSLPRLRELTLGKAAVTDETIPVLQSFTKLQRLGIIDASALPADTLKGLRQALPWCRLP